MGRSVSTGDKLETITVELLDYNINGNIHFGRLISNPLMKRPGIAESCYTIVSTSLEKEDEI